MSIHSMFKSLESARRALDGIQKQQALKVKMLQIKYPAGHELLKLAIDRQSDLVRRGDSLLRQEQLLGNRARVLTKSWELNETVKNSPLVKGINQLLTTGLHRAKPSLAEQVMNGIPILTPAAYQHIQSLGQTAAGIALPLSRMLQEFALPLNRSVQQLCHHYRSLNLLVPVNYDPKAVSRRIERLQAFFADLETIKAALEERDPDRAIFLLKTRLRMWVEKALMMMHTHLQTSYPAGREAWLAERLEAEQELLYSFITRYKQVSKMSYRELISLGDPYKWIRAAMERTMYASLTERGPNGAYLYEDPDAFFKDIDQMGNLKFSAIEAQGCLDWLCEIAERKLVRLETDTASEQLFIVRGIRSGEYFSEEEIKARHSYQDWRAARTKLRNISLSLEF